MSSARTGEASKDNWQTPADLLALIHEFYGGASDLGGGIDFDPCSAEDNPTQARGWATERDDGLLTPWLGKVFCNPPYSKLRAWVEKGAREYERDDCEILYLVPARTDTRAGQLLLSKASAVCFIRGRLRFDIPGAGPAPHPAPFPSMLVYLGDRPVTFRAFFAPLGVCHYV